MSRTPIEAAWAVAGTALSPLLPWWLSHRVRLGKEVSDRVAERRGVAVLPRPSGPLLWLHAASVGETASAVPLLQALVSERPGLQALFTTGTVTSAGLLATRLGEPGPDGTFPALPCVRHQFVPLDVPAWTARFLDHWRPDLAVLVEAELWPTLLGQLRRRAIPAALVNARLSPRSARSWTRFPATARSVLGSFALVTAGSEADAARLDALGAPGVLRFGNLKDAAPPLPDHPDRQAIAVLLRGRPVWLAASTQPAEEPMVLAAHQALAQARPDLLTILAPRHPERGIRVEEAARALGLATARSSRHERPLPGIALQIVDTIGELGLWYRLSSIAFVGGSLVPHGGQNPREPARIGCAVGFGPFMANFAEPAGRLLSAGAAETIASPGELAPWVQGLLDTPSRAAAIASRGLAATAHDAAVLDRTVPALLGLLQTDTEPPRGGPEREGVPSHAGT